MNIYLEIQTASLSHLTENFQATVGKSIQRHFSHSGLPRRSEP